MEVKIEVGIDHGAMDLIISDLCNFPKGNPTSLFHAAESCAKAGLVAASDIIRHQQQRPGKCWKGDPKEHPTVRRVFALAEKALCCAYIRSLNVSEWPWKYGYAQAEILDRICHLVNGCSEYMDWNRTFLPLDLPGTELVEKADEILRNRIPG